MVMAPAIVLIVTAILGMGGTALNMAVALIIEPPTIDTTLPQLAQNIAKATQGGPVIIVFHSLFIILNLIILAGAIQMLRLKMRGFALTVSILAMLNLDCLCCLLGIPVGIWSLIILNKAEVKALFK